MSYQVLARKWRPKRFSEMVGQQHVLKALENALNQDRLHHAYLFTGTRGVGKTTIARIFAKCLNCESGVSAEPCGTCSICESVDQGRFLDLMEIDAASHTGVDSIRELLDNTQYSPTQGRYKIYLIDEVHMLSSSSFNALLKTLEEPPEHVKFLLATTDPQKLPVTVLSRCLQFNLKAMSNSQIAEHLKLLLEKEMIRFEEEAINLIAQAADGSMRDALSLTDQAIAHGNEHLESAEIRAMLGLVDRAYVQGIIEALLARDVQTMLATVESISLDSPNYQSVLAELISYLHRLAVQQMVGTDADQTIKKLAQEFSAEDLQVFYQIALKGRQDLSLAPDPRQGMEMCLLRMILFKPENILSTRSDSEKKNTKISQSAPSQPASKPTPTSTSASNSNRFNKGQGSSSSAQKKESELAIKPSDQHKQTQFNQAIDESISFSPNDNGQEPSKTHQINKPIDSEVPERKPSSEVDIASTYEQIDDEWTQITLKLKLSGPSRIIVHHANFQQVSDEQCLLSIENKYEMLATDQAQKYIAEALSDYFKRTMSIQFEFAALTQASPQIHFDRVDEERRRLAQSSIENDPVFTYLQKEFAAELVDSSAKLNQL